MEKEVLNKAIVGPFKNNPFSFGIKISPLNSVPKKDTSERRVILDLSFPKGNSVNDHINKNEYLGEKIEIVFPKVDDLVQLIKSKGRGCLLYKVDLGRTFRQIPICPSSYNLILNFISSILLEKAHFLWFSSSHGFQICSLLLSVFNKCNCFHDV